jgi:hypothetical protein
MIYKEKTGYYGAQKEKEAIRMANITSTTRTYYESVHKHVYFVHYVYTVCTEQVSSSSNAADTFS